MKKENKFKLIKGDKVETLEDHVKTVDRILGYKSLSINTGDLLKPQLDPDECKGIWLGMTLQCEFCKHVWQDSVHESHVFIKCPGCHEVTNIIGV